jgi:hypothetical protein
MSGNAPSITCPRCGLTSHNPNDVANRYCGNCHVFLERPIPPAVKRLLDEVRNARDYAGSYDRHHNRHMRSM